MYRLKMPINKQYLVFTTLEKKAFENILGKGENAGYKHFLFSPQCFLSIPKQWSSLSL